MMSIPRNLALTAFLLAGVLSAQSAVRSAFPIERARPRPATGFNVRFFNKLSPRKRMQFAVAAVAMRESELSNSTFTGHGRVESVAHNAKQGTWITADDFALRRRGIGFWMHLKQFYSADHRSFSNFFSTWNGSVERGVSYQAGNPSADCVINDRPFSGIREDAFLDMLGFRVNTSLYDTTLAAYLRNALRNKWQHYSARAVRAGNSPQIVVRVSTGTVNPKYRYHHYREYWLDASRGFMPVRYREVYRAQGKVVGTVTGQVTSAKKIHGVWVPMAIKQASANSAMPDVRSAQSFQVKQFTIGTVKPGDLKLEFPKGSRLLNLIKMRAYYKNRHGKSVPQPIYIPQSGKILRPTAPKGSELKP